jgi:multidrug efflux pump subunit AcrA (membrane-fusion protein)
VSAIGEVLDNSSQTIKVRVTLQNKENKFKPGMFATVRFGIKKGNKLAVPQGAIITAQGKNFVFKKEGNTFSRIEVEISNQINDYIEIKSGIHSKDTIVTKGSMLLKGLSFGY